MTGSMGTEFCVTVLAFTTLWVLFLMLLYTIQNCMGEIEGTSSFAFFLYDITYNFLDYCGIFSPYL